MKQKIMTVLLGIIFIEAAIVGTITFARPNIAQTVDKTSSNDVILDSQHIPTNTIDEAKVIHKNKQVPDTKKWLTADEDIRFPILAYQKITTDSDVESKEKTSELSVPLSEFSKQIQWLKENDYYTLTPQEAYLVLTTNKKPAEKIVWLTFDGGYLSNYQNAYPILKKENMQATINYSVNQQGDVVYMTTHDAQELIISGEINIGAYSLSSDPLTEVGQRLKINVPQAKSDLDTLLNQETTVLAYPEGDYNDRLVTEVEDAGYALGLTRNAGYASKANGLYTLNRIPIYAGLSQNDFAYVLEAKY